MIRDLMATVERAEKKSLRARLIAEEVELERLFELQALTSRDEQALVGAA